MAETVADLSLPQELREESEPAPASPLAEAGALRLAWRALLLDERAYVEVVGRPRPMRQGLLILLWILGIVLVARWIGLGLNWLTSPQLGSLQALLHDFVVGLPWYSEQVQLAPSFANQFEQEYFLAWEALRALLGIQTPVSTALWTGLTLLDTLLAWLLYGTLAHWVARWLGGIGRWSQTQGALALAYAPLLFVTVEMIPGAALPLSLLFLLMLVGKYHAVKWSHGLTPGYALAAVLLPYLLGSLLLAAAVLFGAAFGLEQVPLYQQAVEAVRSIWGGWPLR